MNKLFIITGPAGVGKSTISYEIGKRLEKSVVIEGDTIYDFFVGGRIRPWYPDAPLELFWKNSIMLIKSYLESGYDVVFNYIIKNKELDRLKDEFKNYNERTLNTLIDIVSKINSNEKFDIDNYTKKSILDAYNEIICWEERNYILKYSSIQKKQNKFTCEVNPLIFK